MSTDRAENNRNHFRVNFDSPIWGEVKILALNNQPVHTKYAKVFIIDLSASGAKIHTKLNLPTNDTLLLEMKFTIFQNDFKIKANIIRRKFDLQNFVMDYGIRFMMEDENEESLLVSTINLLSLRLKSRNLGLSQLDFCEPQEVKQFYANIHHQVRL